MGGWPGEPVASGYLPRCPAQALLACARKPEESDAAQAILVGFLQWTRLERKRQGLRFCLTPLHMATMPQLQQRTKLSSVPLSVTRRGGFNSWASPESPVPAHGRSRLFPQLALAMASGCLWGSGPGLLLDIPGSWQYWKSGYLCEMFQSFKILEEKKEKHLAWHGMVNRSHLLARSGS